MRRDRRAHGRAVGSRAAPQSRVHVRRRAGQAEMVHRGAGQPRKTPRSQPLNHRCPEIIEEHCPFVYYYNNIMDCIQRSLNNT